MTAAARLDELSASRPEACSLPQGGHLEAGMRLSARHLSKILPTRARIGISESIVSAAGWLPSLRSGVAASKAV